MGSKFPMKTNLIGKVLFTASSIAVLSIVMVLLNTGRVAGAPQPPGTVLVTDQTCTALGNCFSTLLDVSAYKQIRVIVRINNGGVDCGVYLATSDSSGKQIGIMDFIPGADCEFEKVYALPGAFIQLLIINNSISSTTYRIVIYGEKY